MKEIVPDYRLDMVGEPCPYPAVATLEALPQLKKGEILEVVSDCPSRSITFRLMPKSRLYRAGYPAGRTNHSLFNSEVISRSKRPLRGLF